MFTSSAQAVKRKKLILILVFFCILGLALLLFLLLPFGLRGVEWQLKTVQAVGGPALWRPDQPERFTLIFPPLRVRGEDGCGAFYGWAFPNPFTRAFSVLHLDHTLVFCKEPDLRKKSSDYLQAVKSATKYQLQEGELWLYFEAETKVLILTTAQ
jgi:hypothetical protein